MIVKTIGSADGFNFYSNMFKLDYNKLKLNKFAL